MSENNSFIKMVDMKDKGRALVASQPLQAGQIILRDSPILLYDAIPLGGGGAVGCYCCHCFRTIPPNCTTIASCPRCSNASIFCSPQCLSVAISTSHTPFVCQALSILQASNSPLLHHHHDRHLQARFLVAAYNLGMVSPSHFQTLLSLQGEPILDDASTFLHSLISSVCYPFLDNFKIGFSLDLTASLLSKDKLNAFGLMDPFNQDKERSVRAYVIYPRASFFNHDCLPNACRFDYVDSNYGCDSNTDIVVRLIHGVPEGREICISYFPVNLKYSERQKRLKEDYGFSCDCDRCKVEATWSDNEEEGDEDMEAEEDMEEDGDDVVEEDSVMDKENNDFPHAYFFMRYMCNKDNCWGTLAPLPPADARISTVMECNVCGNLSNSDDVMNGNL